MIDSLREIRAWLSQGAYRNEEHVRLNLVARLLQELGWNIWDPSEVYPEWPVAPTEDATKVDLALFVNSDVPSVFIEIKAVGKMAGNLKTVETQVRDYNRNNTAPFSIITDGQHWRLYYSQTGGEFAQKCFKVVDLAEGDLDAAAGTLKTFLSKAEIDIGNAKAEAEKYLRLNQRQRAMEDCLSEARQQVQKPPYPSLPDALVALVGQRNFPVTRDEAISYISTANVGPVQPVASDPEPGGTVPMGIAGKPVAIAETVRTLEPDNPGDLTFSRLLEGTLGNASATRWNELVAAGVRLALAGGVALSDLQASLAANLQEGDPGERGFALIAGTNVSIQNMDSNRSVRNLVILARMLRCSLRVKLRLGKRSPFVGQVGVLDWKP